MMFTRVNRASLSGWRVGTRLHWVLGFIGVLTSPSLMAQGLPKVKKVELQPLVAQVRRLVEATDYLGVPLKTSDKQVLEKAMSQTEANQALAEIQTVLDPYCLFDVHINPESRVKVAPGPVK